MKKGDRVECICGPPARLHKKRGKVVSVSEHLVTFIPDGEDFQFSLPHEEMRVLSAVEHLAEKAE